MENNVRKGENETDPKRCDGNPLNFEVEDTYSCIINEPQN